MRAKKENLGKRCGAHGTLSVAFAFTAGRGYVAGGEQVDWQKTRRRNSWVCTLDLAFLNASGGSWRWKV